MPYEIQWPLKLDILRTGTYGSWARVVDGAGVELAAFYSAHPDYRSEAQKELERLTETYGPPWKTNSVGWVSYNGVHQFQIGAALAVKLVAHLNSTGFVP